VGLGKLLGKVAHLPGKAADAARWKMDEIVLAAALRHVRADKEMGPVFDKILKAFNHKAVYTGAFVAALPKLAAVVYGALVANGFDPLLAAKYTAWGGGVVLVAAGVVNRLVRWADDQTPD
jgi:hypothetical protein